ncbi:MAG: hypothetical protein LUO89_03440 [Methanothrix sp.]|nr:hypothetical protein [Methanothrix sp.]
MWVLEGTRPISRQVRTGLSDGARTEIIAGLQAGEQVIIGSASGAPGTGSGHST